MGKIVTIIMYVLWILTITAVVAATFTNFKYVDLNIFALLLGIFTGLNAFFVLKSKKPVE